MENWKKILLIIGILVFVITLDLVLYFKTDKLINDTQNDLGKLEKILDEELGEGKKSAKELNDKWQGYENTLSFFIEHEEMERVSAKIAIVEENIKNEEYKTALEDIVETRYLLDYIKDKYNLTWKNIF